MMRLVWLVCATVLVGTLSVYSIQSHEPKADLTYVNPSGIHTLDPARMSWLQDFRIALNIWEGLTSLDPETLQPMEGAARFPPAVSENGLTFTFTIRPDARWSPASPGPAAPAAARRWGPPAGPATTRCSSKSPLHQRVLVAAS